MAGTRVPGSSDERVRPADGNPGGGAAADRLPVRLAPAVVRVPFTETDASGVVSHEQFLVYFEAGRAEAMRQVGLSYAQLIQAGFHLPIIEAHVRYLQSARFDDLLLVTAQAADVGRVRLRLDYEIRRDADGQLLTIGSTTHACVSADQLRPAPLPEWAAAGFRLLLPGDGRADRPDHRPLAPARPKPPAR